MNEQLYDVELFGFDIGASDPIEALQRAFGLDVGKARNLMLRLPAVVKKGASEEQARKYVNALSDLGGQVRTLESGSGLEVELPDTHPSGAFLSTEAAFAPAEGSIDQLQDLELRQESANFTPVGPMPVVASSSGAALIRLEAEPSAENPDLFNGQIETRPPNGAAAQMAVTLSATVPSGPGMPPMPAFLLEISDFESQVWTPLVAIAAGATVSEGPRAQAPGSESYGAVGSGARAPRRAPPAYVAAVPNWRDNAPPASGMPKWVAPLFALAVLGAAGAGVYFFAFSTSVSQEVRQALENYRHTYLPTFQTSDITGGSISGQSESSTNFQVTAGQCYGWIATPPTDDQCDLDLFLYQGGQTLMADQAYDSFPVVFTCPEESAEVRVSLINASTNRCSYGLSTVTRLSDPTFTTAAYPGIYLDFMVAMRGGGVQAAIGETRHSHLSHGQRERVTVQVPANQCWLFVAASNQNTDLDMVLYQGDTAIANDAAVDNYPVVQHCANDRPFLGELEFIMYSGSSGFSWQAFDGNI